MKKTRVLREVCKKTNSSTVKNTVYLLGINGNHMNNNNSNNVGKRYMGMLTTSGLVREKALKNFRPRAAVDPEKADPIYLLDAYDMRDPVNFFFWSEQKPGRLPIDWYTDPRRYGSLTCVAQIDASLSFGTTVLWFFGFWGPVVAFALFLMWLDWFPDHVTKMVPPYEYGITHPSLYLEYGGDPSIDPANFESIHRKPDGLRFNTVREVLASQQGGNPHPAVVGWKPLDPSILELKHEGDHGRDYMKFFYEECKKRNHNRDRYQYEWQGPWQFYPNYTSPIYTDEGKRFLLKD